MTDEEMAEEYANKAHTHNILNWEKLKQAFLAGLKAVRPQWHDLRKDPNDLPKGCINVLCFVWQGEGYYCVGHIIKGGDNFARWWASNKSEQLNVIAWCEIPQFKE